jgi:hypothetical protein
MREIHFCPIALISLAPGTAGHSLHQREGYNCSVQAPLFSNMGPGKLRRSGKDMDERTISLRLQLLEWLSSRPRTYSETLEAWRTSCPRFSIWEDACIDGLIESQTGSPFVTISSKGRLFLEEQQNRMRKRNAHDFYLS